MLLYIKPSLNPLVISKQMIGSINGTCIQVKKKKITEICCQDDNIIFGDYNLPITGWDEYALNTHLEHDFYTNLEESFLYQHVEHPTRSDNILDITFTTEENLVSDVEFRSEFIFSDHQVITFNFQINNSK